MPEGAPDWLETVPARLRPPLERAAQGAAPNVALMQLLLECSAAGEAEEALELAIAALRKAGEVDAARRLKTVRALASANPDAFQVVRNIIGGLDHDQTSGAGKLAYWAAAFDYAARNNPAASVALYALGNPELLQAATDEITARLAEWGLLAPDAVCLDLGCGIGRFELALAPRLARIVGVDIAPAMIEEARRRCAALPNAAFDLVSGDDLAGFATGEFSLVLAVDSFPYIVQAGQELTSTMIGEAVRGLQPGGHLAIFNFSYRGDLDQDRSDVARFATRFGLEVIRNGTADFQLWDGRSFVLRKP
jgi:SAM-dependent methyltransferase